MKKTLMITFVLLNMACLFAFAYDPPGEATKRRAIGPTGHLSGIHKKVFAPGDCFPAIPRPGPGDWLSTRKEAGQTYAQLVARRYPKPSNNKGTLYIQPFGSFGEKAPSLELLKEYAGIYFDMPVKILQAIDPKHTNFTSRINERGNVYQLHTGDIRKYLAQRKPRDAYLVLGVTMTDLYPDPAWNFVFGQADYKNQVGIFSFARYHPGFYGWKAEGDVETLILERSLKVMCHEMGHLFGIVHCIHFHCLMNGSNNL